MGRGIDVNRHEVWRKRLERFTGWPGTAAEFCRREGVTQASFHVWRKRLTGCLGPRAITCRIAARRPSSPVPHVAAPGPVGTNDADFARGRHTFETGRRGRERAITCRIAARRLSAADRRVAIRRGPAPAGSRPSG